MKSQPIYPPVISPSPVGVILVVLVLVVFSILGERTLADTVFAVLVALAGGYYVVSSWRERSLREKALYEGMDVEARIVSSRHRSSKTSLNPSMFGVAYWPLKVEYEIDGQKYVSQQEVPESFLLALRDQATLRISVHPERPTVWVPVG